MANFAALIADAARRFPDRPAVESLRGDAVHTTTYAQLMERAAAFAACLQQVGAAGERAAILADNDADWIACYLGALQVGWIAVPLDTAYSADQVRTVLENSGAQVLFTGSRHVETARAAAGQLRQAAPQIVPLSGSAERSVQPPESVPPADVAPDTPAVILYTSGTTADPKGVVLTHENLEAERRGALSIVHVTEDDAILGVLPLFHALAQMANLLLPLAVGARIVFLETVSSSSVLQALATREISIFACVPQFFYLIHQRVMAEVSRKSVFARAIVRTAIGANVWLRDRIGWNVGPRVFARVHRVLGRRMRVLVSGGSRFDPAVGRDLYGMGFTILNAYGLTETSGGATIVRPGDRFTSSVGQPFPGVDVRIDRPERPDPGDPEASAADDHQDGEVLIRGPIVMREYYRRPDATAEALQDGWLRTGDLGRLDRDGRLYITGRKKEIIVLGSGKNLYPEEIEAHYVQSPFIKELCVLGVARPGEPAAERLHAVIVPDERVLKERGIVNVRELVRFELESLSVRLPAHKRILSYDVSFEPLPRTTTGKIRRHQVERRMRAMAESSTHETTRAVADDERAWLADPPRAAAIEAITARLGNRRVLPNDNLELDLGLDSMERVELLSFLEHRAGVRVPAETRAEIFTVRQLVDAVQAITPGSAAAAAGDAGTGWTPLLTEAPEREIVDTLSRPHRVLPPLLWVAGRVARLAMRALTGLRVSGVERLPRTGVCIICPNHQSHLDPFVLGSVLPYRILRQMFFVGAAEYYETRFAKWVARALRVIPIDPDANLVSAMRAGAAGLRLGRVLILFPEGERSIDAQLKPFRKGAAILSAHTGVPLIPVAIDGLFPIWPRGRPVQWRALLPWRSAPIVVRIGDPIHAGIDRYAEDTARLQDAVASLRKGAS
jgi:long-chain acyl-CoA synthetase